MSVANYETAKSISVKDYWSEKFVNVYSFNQPKVVHRIILVWSIMSCNSETKVNEDNITY